MRIANDRWELVVDPALGGTIAALRRGGLDILRPTPAGSDSPLETGCFPLVPYVNRIAGGRFTIDGEERHLPRNMTGQAHPLHGVGWLRRWSVTEQAAASITLAHDHAPDKHWPWAYAAEQRFTLSREGLRVTLTITARDDRAMPVGLGFHPYFTVAGVRSLRFHAGSMWLSDETLIPVERTGPHDLADWDSGEGVMRQTLIDNSYDEWTGEAVIVRDDGDVRIGGENTPFFHLYMPPGADFFCAEPTDAIANAVNRPDPAMLAPGERRTIAMAILDA